MLSFLQESCESLPKTSLMPTGLAGINDRASCSQQLVTWLEGQSRQAACGVEFHPNSASMTHAYSWCRWKMAIISYCSRSSVNTIRKCAPSERGGVTGSVIVPIQLVVFSALDRWFRSIRSSLEVDLRGKLKAGAWHCYLCSSGLASLCFELWRTFDGFCWQKWRARGLMNRRNTTARLNSLVRDAETVLISALRDR